MAFCRTCGTQLGDDAIFCAECGTSTGATAQGKKDNAVRSFASCDNGSCQYTYDSDVGDPEHGIPPGTLYDDLPADWVCPLCGKRDFLIRL